MIKVLLYALPLVLAVYALVDCVQTDESQVRGLPKLVWVVLIVLVWVVGPVTWLIAGKQRRPGQLRAWPVTPRAGGGPARPTRPLAPDDDPDFLRSLGGVDRDQQRLLEQWEQDLRRREDDSRDDRDPGEDGGAGGRPTSDPPAS